MIKTNSTNYVEIKGYGCTILPCLFPDEITNMYASAYSESKETPIRIMYLTIENLTTLTLEGIGRLTEMWVFFVIHIGMIRSIPMLSRFRVWVELTPLSITTKRMASIESTIRTDHSLDIGELLPIDISQCFNLTLIKIFFYNIMNHLRPSLSPFEMLSSSGMVISKSFTY